jgi:hypothetical protein
VLTPCVAACGTIPGEGRGDHGPGGAETDAQGFGVLW